MDSTAWDERYRVTDRLWSAEPNLFVADRLTTAEPGVGVDLASGEGRNAIWLAEHGWKMTAVDFSEVAIERGRAASDQVEFVVADVLQWAPADKVDLVLVSYLHLMPEEMSSVVARVTGWLSPGGELFMIGHDRSNLEKGHGGPQIPEILWEVNEVLEWLNGLNVVEAQVVRRPVETEDGLVFARDSLVRVRAG